jgi:hypothetical protein
VGTPTTSGLSVHQRVVRASLVCEARFAMPSSSVTGDIWPDFPRAAQRDVPTPLTFSRQQAYVICSVAVDLRISNVVDVPNYVVSALLPEAIFDGA